MNRVLEYPFLKKKYTSGKYTQKKIADIISYYGKAN